MTTARTMKRSWLVQRLEKPRRSILGPDNPFAFGGGYRNGGLSAEAMGLLRGIFSFDYMGAAEFEFGAVPQALQGIAKDAESLTAYQLDIPLSKVKRHWRDKGKDKPKGSATVYVLSRSADRPEVEARIRAWAAGDERLKERTNLPSVLRPYGDYTPDTCGWLELDNGFSFFTDRDMWQQVARLFGVEVPG